MSNIHVVVGIIIHDGLILVAKRPDDKHLGSLWEFPGGKLHNQEDPDVALIRELKEEIGINVTKARPFIRFTYKYTDRSILMDVWLINEWYGEIHGCEHQEVCWIKIENLNEYTMPPANKIIINALKLPTLYLICPKPEISNQDYLNKIDNCLDAGVKLLQLRCGDEFMDEHPDFVYKIIEKCDNYGAKLLLNTTPEKVILFNAHGVHLSGNRIKQLDKRPFDHSKYVAVSCHDKYELKHACEIDADFLVLSPVLKTSSHPQSKPLGWDCFYTLVQNITVPVFALGGMQCSHMKIAWEHGAQGVAIQSYIWQSANLAEKVRKCLQID